MPFRIPPLGAAFFRVLGNTTACLDWRPRRRTLLAAIFLLDGSVGLASPSTSIAPIDMVRMDSPEGMRNFIPSFSSKASVFSGSASIQPISTSAVYPAKIILSAPFSVSISIAPGPRTDSLLELAIARTFSESLARRASSTGRKTAFASFDLFVLIRPGRGWMSESQS